MDDMANVSGAEMCKQDVWMQERRRKFADHEAITFSAPRMSGVIPPPRGVYRVLVGKPEEKSTGEIQAEIGG
jgi:hypothetical protein